MKSPFGMSGEGVPPSDVHANEERPKEAEALPALELKEVLRSPNPINEVTVETEKKKRRVEALHAWHDYTIVLIHGTNATNALRILDEQGRVVTDFSSLGATEIELDLGNFLKRNNKGYLQRYSSDPGNLSISQLPSYLQKYASQLFQESSSDGRQPDAIHSAHIRKRKEALDPNNIEVFKQGKYVLVRRGGNDFFLAFDTESEGGVSQAPRNWKRMIPTDVIPEELQEYLKETMIEEKGYTFVSEEYTAQVTDTEVAIVSSKNLKSVMFHDKVAGVQRNLCVDPQKPNVIYYISQTDSNKLVRLDMSGDPKTWVPETAEFPKQYGGIRELRFDPSGNFFLFYDSDDFVMIAKDTLQEVKRVPKISHVHFDEKGRMRAVDGEGHLVIYEPQFEEIERRIKAQRVAEMAGKIRVSDIFAPPASRVKKEKREREASFEHLKPLREQYERDFADVLVKATTEEAVRALRPGLDMLRAELAGKGLSREEATFIQEGLEAHILEKESEFATQRATEILASVRKRLDGGLSMTMIAEVREALDGIAGEEALLSEALRQEMRTARETFRERATELFRQRGSEIVTEVQGMLLGVRRDVGAITTKAQFDEWQEFRFPQLKGRLTSLLRDCPLEAHEAAAALASARTELQAVADSHEEKFKREYAKVREHAADRIEAVVDAIHHDVTGFIERLRAKGFTSRNTAEQYIGTSEALKSLEVEIAALGEQNPDAAKDLLRILKVHIANALTEIERQTLVSVAETGQQMVLFGKTSFPKWEAKVHERQAREVDLTFIADEQTKGPGVRSDAVLGDVALLITSSDGKRERVRLYEGLGDEDEWRLGLHSYRGKGIPPSYVSAGEFRKIKRDASDWMHGASGTLQKDLAEKRRALQEIYARRESIVERDPERDAAWKEEYRRALEDYATFFEQHHIVLLKRMDAVRREEDVAGTNGKGFVPEWQGHWVVDPETERHLEDMAKLLKMQLDLQEGLLDLKGHAGTGKDVLVKMFAAMTHRPYFAFDCTKWTTEFELSEDIVLEAKDGASQTVKIPSRILNGILTPGAIVYFNELTAMPEQAQIFLHSLMDEKRTLTLKTSSGRAEKAHPSVVLIGSENPGYPGTFAPQFATRSRMVSLDVEYPPLTRERKPDDPNPNAPYNASEALRIAREVDSLADLTYEANLERNGFVQLWDRYVNGIANGVPEPTVVQKFDLDTILALVQFANKLRGDFVKIFEKSRDARTALPVTQPITGRELRRCAYVLSAMPDEEKTRANPETVARELLGQFYLTHIDKTEDRGKIQNAMATWTSQKRLGAS